MTTGITVNRRLILLGAIVLQVASWFDMTGVLNNALGIPVRSMSALQTAQLVGSGVLVLVFLSIKRVDTREQ